jgi:prepilin-type processing-associated H-X9-DG protein
MLPPRFWTYEKAFRHQDEKANFIYADGHVKFQKQTDFGKFENGDFVTDFTKWHWN